MKKSIYKKSAFKVFEYQTDYQKKAGKKIARSLSRARNKNFWKKELD